MAGEDKRLLISSPTQSAVCFLDPSSTLRVLTSGDVEAAILDEGDECFFSTDAIGLTRLILTSDEPGPGDQITVDWASTSSVACRATGDLPGWASSNIGTQGPTTATVSEDAAAGDYRAIVVCGEAAKTVESELSVSVAARPAPSAPDLSVTPNSISQGNSFAIEWSSNNANTCTASGTLPGWAGEKDTSGSVEISTDEDTPTGAFTISLVCSNSGGDSERTTETVSIVRASDCGPERSLPEDWPRLITGDSSCLFVPGVGFNASADCRSFNAIWPNEFLEVTGVTRRIATNRAVDGKGYVAIEISTAGMAPDATGSIFSTAGGPGIQFSRRLATISSCPGDFNKAAVDDDTGCYFALTGVTPSMPWGGPESGRNCSLEPDRRYFLNIIASDSPVGTDPQELEPAAACVDHPDGYSCAAVYEP